MNGDSEFEDLVQAWYDPLYRFAYSLTGRREDALDLTQNTFLKWARKRQTVRKRHKAKSWLFTVLYREFLDQARRSTRFPNVELKEEVLQHNEGGEPRRHLDSQSAVQALGTLEEYYRAPLALFYFQSHSYREISEILDVPIGTVMSRIRRGKDRLKQQLETPAESGKTVVPFARKQAES